MLSYFFPVLLFLSGFWVVISKHMHLLVVLLGLEYIVIGVYFFIISVMVSFSVEVYFSIVFLTFAVCEGSLGLGVLVSMSRTHGNDYFSSFSVLQC
uniref:NADH-ubiquinone oxidoreductase chain 4L n=1 Tax=Parajapyx emeryanus TaxID=165473 RepID=U3KTJ2_9HEXA|nr:NADH dehydrogenase subunit 4L [Parajapyx emeryanus]AEV44856.1 NADH dehydrogenase subunit 4L [Parajapyx emeryanus]